MNLRFSPFFSNIPNLFKLTAVQHEHYPEANLQMSAVATFVGTTCIGFVES
jgi:hypothetical protein